MAKKEDKTPLSLRPLDDRVVVEALEAEEKTSGGILLPDTAKQKPRQGQIIAVGPGKLTVKGDRTAVAVKIGDTVLFGKYSGSDIKVDGRELKILRESDILALSPSPPGYPILQPDPAVSSGDRSVTYWSGPVSQFDVTKRVMTDFRFGKTRYRFLETKLGTFFQTSAGGVFQVEGLPLTLHGKGETPDVSYHDWLKNFHICFQRLSAMRPFEMDEHDRTLWSAIESAIDVERYRMSRPLIVRQEGKVIRARPEPQAIRWADGTREKVNLAKMPGEFVTFKAGQTFEAIVYRNPISYKMIKTDYVKRLSPKHLTPEESQKLWDSIPTSSSLPDTTWD